MSVERDYIKGLGVRSSQAGKYIPLSIASYCDQRHTSVFGHLSTARLQDKDKPYSIYVLHKLLRNE